MDQHIGSELPPLEMEKNNSPGQTQNGEFAPHMERTELQANQAVERGTAPAPAPAPLPPQHAYQPAQTAQAQALPAASDPAAPVMADDTDLIEKEWVLKAKEIVARTSQDPYQQNKEVEKMKADYLKKRYNKDIKLTED